MSISTHMQIHDAFELIAKVQNGDQIVLQVPSRPGVLAFHTITLCRLTYAQREALLTAFAAPAHDTKIDALGRRVPFVPAIPEAAE